MSSHTAGTAGDGYRSTRDHAYRPSPPEPGMRPLCCCGRTRAEHGGRS